MYKRKLVLFIVSFVMSMPAMASYSAHELALDCGQYILMRTDGLPSMSFDDGLRIGRCAGFMKTFFDSHAAITQIQSSENKTKTVPLFSLPGEENYNKNLEVIYDLLLWLRERDKESLKMPASKVVLKFLMEKYPNPNQSSGG